MPWESRGGSIYTCIAFIVYLVNWNRCSLLMYGTNFPIYRNYLPLFYAYHKTNVFLSSLDRCYKTSSKSPKSVLQWFRVAENVTYNSDMTLVWIYTKIFSVHQINKILCLCLFLFFVCLFVFVVYIYPRFIILIFCNVNVGCRSYKEVHFRF